MISPSVLVDTSIWIDHLNNSETGLVALLRRKQVIMHPMVAGEVALGSLRDRKGWTSEADALPRSPVASHTEVMALIEWGKLYSKGIGYVDAHLLAAVRLVRGTSIWTRDKCLRAQADRMELAFKPLV